LEEGAATGGDYIVGESQNHYSSRYERCFVQVSVSLSRQAAREMKQSGTLNKTIPFTHWLLYDAFEGRDLTTCTSSPVEGFCDIGGVFGNCSECRKFTNDRMNDSDPTDPFGIPELKPGGALDKLLKESKKQDSK
jgi:hypothetical protein